MSWIGSLAEFAKQLFKLQGRVEKNTEEIAAIRQDLKVLTEFTRKVAYAVQRNHDKHEHSQENLLLRLENELLKLETRLSTSSQFISVASAHDQKRLADGNGRVSSIGREE